MASYLVYFSPKAGVSGDALIAAVHQFMKSQIEANYAEGYRILRMTDKASFAELPDFQLIVDYESEEALKKGFAGMKATYREEPHLSLMKMVSDFKVAFSMDEELSGGAEAGEV